VRIAAVLTLIASFAAAGDRRQKLLKDVVGQIERSLASGDFVQVRAAMWRAKSIRDRYNDKQAMGLARAIALGAKNRDNRIAVTSLATLGELGVKGSGKLVAHFLTPPARLDEDRLGVWLAGIEAVGVIHDVASVKPLEKLLLHRNTAISSEAARALGNYWILDRSLRLSLIKRLTEMLEKLEALARNASKDSDRDHYHAVYGALLRGMNRIAERRDLNTVAVWKSWIKAEHKRMQDD